MNKKSKLLGLVPILIFLAVWEVIANLRIVPSYMLPPFSRVIITLFNLMASGELFIHFYRSFLRVAVGFALGASSGIILGIGMGYNDLLERALNPIMYVLYPIPALGWLPLLIIWVGINDALPILIIFICSFFPLLYNTMTGIKMVDKQIIKVAKTLGATNFQILKDIVAPLALPNIFTGLKLEAGMAWRTVIAAEMVAIPIGLGALAIKAQSLLLVDVIIVVLLVLSIICLVSEKLFEYLEYKLTSEWR